MQKILKRIVYALCLLYSINIVIYIYGIIVPVNLFSIILVSIFGIFGVMGILLLKYML